MLNEGKFINTEPLARKIYNFIAKLPEMHMGEFSHIRPFRQSKELYEEFYNLVYPYSGHNLELPFPELVRKIKEGFLIRYLDEPTSGHDEEYDTMADVKGFQITLYETFFTRYNKRQRIETLSHELMHLVQHMFKYDIAGEGYHDDPREVEALSKDIVFDLRRKIRDGVIKTQSDAKKYLEQQHDYQEFPAKFKKKMWKKILVDLYYYNPVIEGLNESKYFDVGNLPEMMLKRIEDVLWFRKLNVYRGKDGAVKIKKKQNLSKKLEVEYGLFHLDLDLWKEFKRVLLSKYSSDLLDERETKKMYRDSLLTICPNKKGNDGAFAFVNPLGLFLFKDFFNMGKGEQTSVLHHEITHLLQSQFPIFAGAYWEKMRRGKATKKELKIKTKRGLHRHKYEHDPFEVEAYGSELVKMIGDAIKRDQLKSMEEVSIAVREHPLYELTNAKLKKKMFQKVMSVVKSQYNLPIKIDTYLESLNELKLPSIKLSDDELMDKILLRKEHRKQNIEGQFILIFFNILRSYNIEPGTFINRYHKYISGDKNINTISIEEIIQFLRFVGITSEHAKVAQVLKISSKRIEYLKTKMDVKLIKPIKRIMRHDTTDKTRAGLHSFDTKKRYNAMLVKAMQSNEKVMDLKENVINLTALSV